MNRRKSLGLIAGISPLLLFPNNQILDKNFDSSEWLKHFKFRWSNSRIYCFEIFNSMPLANYEYKPLEDSMSFMKLFTHIGSGTCTLSLKANDGTDTSPLRNDTITINSISGKGG